MPGGPPGGAAFEDDKDRSGPGGGAAPDEAADTKMGLISVNNLVYKLEPDLSVAVNRTQKNGYFQSQTYTDRQTSLCIFNSGADYIDPARSFLQLQIDPPVTQVTSTVTDPLYNSLVSFFFGPTGSVLNLIDQVTVSSRSGDELSRVNDYGQMMYHLIPWMFSSDWAKTVGEEIGLGGVIGGKNSNGVPSLYVNKTFKIPLYLVSPFFTYGRLMPSMVMSGLRIEIKWKTLETSTQMFWEGVPLMKPLDFAGGTTSGMSQWNAGGTLYESNNFVTVNKQYLWPVADAVNVGNGALDTAVDASTIQWDVSSSSSNSLDKTNLFDQRQLTAVGANQTDWKTGQFPGDVTGRPPFIIGVDSIGWVDTSGYLREYEVTGLDAHTGSGGSFTNSIRVTVTTPLRLQAVIGTGPGLFRYQRYPIANKYQRQFGGEYYGNLANLPTSLVADKSGYNIVNPMFSLSSVQLSDAVQRHLNEYSSTNGLELVYADWDRTSAPIPGTGGSSSMIYTEVRKSASRALMAFAVMVNADSNPQTRNSYQALQGGSWKHYQYQVGSLYFPQQRAEDTQTDEAQRFDGMLGLTYALACDAFDRWHPRAAPSMLALRTRDHPWNVNYKYPVTPIFEPREEPYLYPYSNYGQAGTFANGNQCVAVTLERSTMFDLSGIPINNSRVLALRGEYKFQDTVNAVLFVFLKYVRLARIFLINVEVEQ